MNAYGFHGLGTHLPRFPFIIKMPLVVVIVSIYNICPVYASRIPQRCLESNTSPTSIPFEQWLNLFDYFKHRGREQAWHTIAGSEKRLMQQQKRVEKVHRTRINWRKIE